MLQKKSCVANVTSCVANNVVLQTLKQSCVANKKLVVLQMRSCVANEKLCIIQKLDFWRRLDTIYMKQIYRKYLI